MTESLVVDLEIDVVTKGDKGDPGEQGQRGEQGTLIRYGTGSPSDNLGNDGDFYLDQSVGMLYGPKGFGEWPDGTSLVGPSGRSLLNGATDPANNVGNVGDFYINTVANTLFGPKEALGWGEGTSIVGPTGPTGATGATGPTGATGTGDLTALTTGESVMPRLNEGTAGISMTSGTMRIAYFTSRKNETKTSVRIYCITGGGIPTLTKVGIYSINESTGDLTLIGSSANDVTLLRTSSTTYTCALQAGVPTVAGTRYAVGWLVVSANTAPQVSGSTMPSTLRTAQPPRLCASYPGQTDIPSSVLAAALVNTTVMVQSELLP